MKILYRLISIGIGIFFLLALRDFIGEMEKISLTNFFSRINPLKLAIALTAYLFSHFLRALRIASMIGQQNFSFTMLVRKQFYSNGINLVLPFKLGEFYRIAQFATLFKNSERTFLTVLAERTLDFILLFTGLFIALYATKYHMINLETTILIGCCFIMLVLIIYYILPENLRSINLFLAKRYSGESLIKLLSVSHKLLSLITNIKAIFKKRSLTILLLTLLIWLSEIAGLYFISDFVDTPHLFLLAFFVFLSALIPSGSLGIGSLQFAFYLIFLAETDFPYLELSLIYQLFIFLPAIALSFIIYLASKFKFLSEIILWKKIS